MRHLFRSVRVFLISKKWASTGVCLALAALMFWVVNYPAAVGASASARQLPIYCVQRDQKLVSISFDAAWGDVRVRQSFSFRTAALFLIIDILPQIHCIRQELINEILKCSRFSVFCSFVAVANE